MGPAAAQLESGQDRTTAALTEEEEEEDLLTAEDAALLEEVPDALMDQVPLDSDALMDAPLDSDALLAQLLLEAGSFEEEAAVPRSPYLPPSPTISLSPSPCLSPAPEISIKAELVKPEVDDWEMFYDEPLDSHLLEDQFLLFPQLAL